jgi:hypothetical protein
MPAGGVVMLRAAARGALLGIGWGVLARVFMRLLTTTPEFSWAGTMMILGLSTVLWVGIALVDRGRVTARSRWWRLAPVPGLVLFFSPGMLLLPGAVGVALWRALRSRLLGWLFLVAGMGVVLFALLSDDTFVGVSNAPVRAWLGVALLVVATFALGLGLHAWTRRWGARPAPGDGPLEAGPAAYGPGGWAPSPGGVDRVGGR